MHARSAGARRWPGRAIRLVHSEDCALLRLQRPLHMERVGLQTSGWGLTARKGRVMARVLCIDDEPGLRRLVRRILEQDGHVVVTASNGIEGLQLACGESYDL